MSNNTKSYKTTKSLSNDVSFLLGNATVDELFAKYKALCKKNIDLRKKRYSSKKLFIEALETENKIQMLWSRIYNYIWIKKREEISNPKIREKYQEIMNNVPREFAAPGEKRALIFANKLKIREYLQDPELKKYVSYYERILREEKHRQSENVQKYLDLAAYAEGSPGTSFSILVHTELQFSKVLDEAGRQHTVNNHNIDYYYTLTNHQLRKAAIDSYWNGFLKVKNTLSYFLYQYFHKNIIHAKLKKHNNVIDYLLDKDQIPNKAIQQLYKSAQKYLDLYQKANQAHSKVYQAKFKREMTKYDYDVPIAFDENQYKVEQQKEIVINALKPMGKKYLDIVKKALNGNWLVVLQDSNNLLGYSSITSTYDLIKEVIQMSDESYFDAILSLTHQLGHCIHSLFAEQNQYLRDSKYKIFIGDIASTLNELLLGDYILNSSNNLKLKFQILHKLIRDFDHQVFEQILLSNYEYDLYKVLESGEEVFTFPYLEKIFLKSAQKYSRFKNFKSDQVDSSLAIRVDQYYFDFAIYKGAISFLCAVLFFQHYKVKGEVVLKNYMINFLSMGGKLEPLELLRFNNIDLTNPQVYDNVFTFYKEIIEQYEKLSKQLKF